MRRLPELVLDPGGRNPVVNDRHGGGLVHRITKEPSEVRSRRRGDLGPKKVTWGAEGRAIEQVRGRAGRVGSDRSPQPQEHKREMLHPAGITSSTCPGDQAVFQSSVLPLNHPVALRVTRRGELAGDAKAGGELTPELTSELASTVGDDGIWAAEPRDPVPDEGRGARLGRDVTHGNGFEPTRIPVYDSHEVRLAL